MILRRRKKMISGDEKRVPGDAKNRTLAVKTADKKWVQTAKKCGFRGGTYPLAKSFYPFSEDFLSR